MPIKRLTTAEAAERLGTTRSQILAMIRRGAIRAKKFGWAWMIAEKDLEGATVGPKGRPRPATCRRGHPYSAETTYVYPSGARGCRICMAARANRNYQAKKSSRSIDK